jgi:hypothetical protein
MVIGIEVNDHDEDVIGIPQISLWINKSDVFWAIGVIPLYIAIVCSPKPRKL